MKNNKKAYSKLFKAALATSVAAGAMVAVAPFNTEAAGFKDLASTHVHYSSIMDLSDRGVIKGYTDGTFKPEASVTRGQAAKIIALTLGLDTKNVVNPNFKDIKADNEYYGPIAALVAEGIVSGKADGTFAPGEKLTRSQMAKIITLAFGFEEGKLTDTKFKDVKATDWYNGYLQTLLDNEITTGTTPTTFSPYENVKRGQMASFVVRAEAAVKPVKVISVSDNSVETSTGKYTVAEDLKKVLNATNAAALKDANIRFTEKDGQIVAVKSIEITADGTEAANIVLDGASSTIASDVKVNGDYVTLKNLTITGDLLIGQGVEKSFLADKIVVKGNTEVSDKSTGVSAAAVTVDAKIGFSNSDLARVILLKRNSLLSLTGTSSVSAIFIDAPSTITADKKIIIPHITAGTGASEVNLIATVKVLSVDALTFALNGNAKIELLELIKKDLKLTLGTSMSIADLVLPAGTTASGIISNFNAVKGQITEIGGVKNPDAGQVTPPAAGGGGGTGGGDNGGSDEVVKTAEQLINDKIESELAKVQDNAIDIDYTSSNKTFNVTTDGSTLKEFAESASASTVYNTLKGLGQVNQVTLTYVGQDFPVTIEEEPDFATAVQRVVSNLNSLLGSVGSDKTIDYEDTTLSALEGKEISFSVSGSIDGKNFTNLTYTFKF